jgi:ribosome biogenesis GTPase
LKPARVAVEDKHRFVVLGEEGELSGQVAGKLLHDVESRAGLPKVGDWAAISVAPAEAKAVIHGVLPRRTKLVRKVAGREVEEQVLAANIDIAFVVQALDQTFNTRRLERFLVMALEGGAKPVVVLNKTDLCPSSDAMLAEASTVAGDAPIVSVSAKTGRGMKVLREFIRPAETVVFVGSSGVGKSSLINRLYGEEIQATIEVRESDAKGRHTTTWRELILLPNGGLVIDTPPSRVPDVGADEGLNRAFPEIDELAVRCHFRDCSHTVEKRCAVQEAVATGRLPRERYDGYLKLMREMEYLSEEKANTLTRSESGKPKSPSARSTSSSAPLGRMSGQPPSSPDSRPQGAISSIRFPCGANEPRPCSTSAGDWPPEFCSPEQRGQSIQQSLPRVPKGFRPEGSQRSNALAFTADFARDLFPDIYLLRSMCIHAPN